MNPFRWLCLPVRITARLGPQIEFVQKLFRKSIPSLASRSMFGVGSTTSNLPPYAPIACGAWSSLKTNRMLGRSSMNVADLAPPDDRLGDKNARRTQETAIARLFRIATI